MTASVRIAAAQYSIGEPDSFASWQAKVGQWVGDAAAQGAQLLVFPEYAAMELAAIDKATASDLHASLMRARNEAISRGLATSITPVSGGTNWTNGYILIYK